MARMAISANRSSPLSWQRKREVRQRARLRRMLTRGFNKWRGGVTV